MTATYESVYPADISAAHGRIAAYRAALIKAVEALGGAYPYIYNVQADPANSPWRRETAQTTLQHVQDARDLAIAELEC